jgi:hypothetical protein
MDAKWAKMRKPSKRAVHGVEAGTQTEDDGKLEKVARLKEEMERVAGAARIKRRAAEIAREHLDSHQSALTTKLSEALGLIESSLGRSDEERGGGGGEFCRINRSTYAFWRFRC